MNVIAVKRFIQSTSIIPMSILLAMSPLGFCDEARNKVAIKLHRTKTE